MTPTKASELGIEELRTLVREAEDAYWNEPEDAILGEGTRQAFVARYLFDQLHPQEEASQNEADTVGYGAGV